MESADNIKPEYNPKMVAEIMQILEMRKIQYEQEIIETRTRDRSEIVNSKVSEKCIDIT